MKNNEESANRMEGYKAQEFVRKNFTQIAVDGVNWNILHRDPKTGEYWKEFFPQSEMHGGGPPVLVKISEEEAKREFNLK
jgi:hypothetical protein